MSEATYQCDVLVIAAHPDDAEILVGGTIARLAKEGKRVVVADATRGEMGTRGTREERTAEAAAAAEILGVERTNLDLPDGGVGTDLDVSERAVVRAIRQYRPRIIMTHTGGDHHPDHNAIHTATHRAFFRSNTTKYDTGQERHKPLRLFYFLSGRTIHHPEVDFITDISDYWDQKMEALRAFKTQFAGGQQGGPQTYLTSDLYWNQMESRYGYYGSLIGVRYGEPFLVEGVLRLDDPTTLPDLKESYLS